MHSSLINNQTFNQTAIKERVFKEAEEPFTFGGDEFPSQPHGKINFLVYQLKPRSLIRIRLYRTKKITFLIFELGQWRHKFNQ